MPLKPSEIGRSLTQPLEKKAQWSRGPVKLRLEATLPSLSHGRLFNSYYARLYRTLSCFCRERLLPVLPDAPAQVSLQLGFQTYFAATDLLSVDCTLSCQHTALVRSAAVWDLHTGFPVPLRRFFPKLRFLRSRIYRFVFAELTRRAAKGEALYDPAVEKLARQVLSPDNFLLTPEGLVLFYPLMSLGPLAEGIPAFQLPWNALGPNLPQDPACVLEAEVL